eukprot:361643-Chlamydomonas_euryale.AAC.3
MPAASSARRLGRGGRSGATPPTAALRPGRRRGSAPQVLPAGCLRSFRRSCCLAVPTRNAGRGSGPGARPGGEFVVSPRGRRARVSNRSRRQLGGWPAVAQTPRSNPCRREKCSFSLVVTESVSGMARPTGLRRFANPFSFSFFAIAFKPPLVMTYAATSVRNPRDVVVEADRRPQVVKRPPPKKQCVGDN